MDRFSLEAWVKTDKHSGRKQDITPQKFMEGDRVLQLNPHTLKPYDNKADLIMGVMWYAETWFYLLRPIVGELKNGDSTLPIVNSQECAWVNEECLTKA